MARMIGTPEEWEALKQAAKERKNQKREQLSADLVAKLNRADSTPLLASRRSKIQRVLINDLCYPEDKEKSNLIATPERFPTCYYEAQRNTLSL